MGAAVVLLIVSAAAPSRALLFGGPDGWLVLDGKGAVVKRFTTFGGRQAKDAAVSPDGRTFAFTAWDETAHNELLYVWREGDAAPKLLGEAQGFHAAPAFSGDGKWVTFDHHPKKGGPPGQHEEGANAQLYRVRADGTALEALTAAPGCHMASFSRDGESVFFAHANCRGQRVIKRLRAGEETTFTSWDDASGEPSLSADGKRLLYVRTKGDELELHELPLGTRQSRLLWKTLRIGERFRPAYADDGRAAFLQADGAVWRVSLSTAVKPQRIVELLGEGP